MRTPVRAYVRHRESDPETIQISVEPARLLSAEAHRYLIARLAVELDYLVALPLALPTAARPLPPGVVGLETLQARVDERMRVWLEIGSIVWDGQARMWRVYL